MNAFARVVGVSVIIVTVSRGRRGFVVLIMIVFVLSRTQQAFRYVATLRQ